MRSGMKETKQTRPANGCARCVWWYRRGRRAMGVCKLYREQRYFKFPPCSEYEKYEVPDTIIVAE